MVVPVQVLQSNLELVIEVHLTLDRDARGAKFGALLILRFYRHLAHVRHDLTLSRLENQALVPDLDTNLQLKRIFQDFLQIRLRKVLEML